MTTRGLGEDDFKKIADFVDRGLTLAKTIKLKKVEGKKIADF